MSSLVEADVATMDADPLAATYTLAFRRQSDDWVAIGSITSPGISVGRPVWLIVGVGKSPAGAEARLRSALEREAERVRRFRVDPDEAASRV